MFFVRSRRSFAQFAAATLLSAFILRICARISRQIYILLLYSCVNFNLRISSKSAIAIKFQRQQNATTNRRRKNWRIEQREICCNTFATYKLRASLCGALSEMKITEIRDKDNIVICQWRQYTRVWGMFTLTLFDTHA